MKDELSLGHRAVPEKVIIITVGQEFVVEGQKVNLYLREYPKID